jgi:ribose transport system permease protein/rhamnose transport system permease protein
MKDIVIGSIRALALRRLTFLLIANAGIALLMGQLSPYFFTVSDGQAILQYGAVLGLLALGQTIVIISGGGGIDLSIGGMLSLTGIVFASLVAHHNVPVVAAGLLAVGLGLGLGAFNGVAITIVGIPPLIATLGTYYLYSSLALVATDGSPLSGFPNSFANLGQGFVLEIPNQFLFVVVPVTVMLTYLLRGTILGRAIYLVGVNENAARLSGISVIRARMAAYMISGLVAALGAMITASWLMSARPDAGANYELQSITVAVLGGTYIFGGEGTLGGSLLAVLLVTMLATGLQLANIDPTWQLGILGVVLLVAVTLNEYVFRQGIHLRLRRALPTAEPSHV